ncbi:unnamed protein product [Phytophthora fragariaefolia]|uniref:Unnamed protein product n=1 Tax=Phytophthora fragariaefolia TaxID=1490495 RepID=A0A9W6XQP7_9STRA|nr:unnamed protein product [Phytophthora fragariaefolia]
MITHLKTQVKCANPDSAIAARVIMGGVAAMVCLKRWSANQQRNSRTKCWKSCSRDSNDAEFYLGLLSLDKSQYQTAKSVCSSSISSHDLGAHGRSSQLADSLTARAGFILMDRCQRRRLEPDMASASIRLMNGEHEFEFIEREMPESDN